MAYNTKSMLTDAHGRYIPQYFNPTTNVYEPIEGENGSMNLIVADSDGVVLTQAQILNTLTTAFASVENKLDELIGVLT